MVGTVRELSLLPLFATAELAPPSSETTKGRQIAFMRERYPDAEIVSDVGSGLNFKRRGLRSLLERLVRGDKLSIVVACRDRLCRCGFELFEFLVEQNGGKLVVQDQSVCSLQAELTADLLAILHV